MSSNTYLTFQDFKLGRVAYQPGFELVGQHLLLATMFVQLLVLFHISSL
jgi:hypothetical protein